MIDFKVFLTLFFKRFLKPVNLVKEKVYQKIPSSIKSYLTTDNLQFFILALLLLLILSSYLWPKTKVDQTRIAVARWPFSVKKHVQLAKVFFENGDLKKARLEITKAKDLYQFLAIFDFKRKTKSTLETGELLINQPENIEEQINYWQTILKTKPDFRDAYLRLSLLYYQLQQDEKAKEAWQKAFYLDPNNEIVEEIGKLIGEIKS